MLPAALTPPQACYAMGYNLAIEYLADYEKTWMLDSFRALDERVLAPAGRPLTEWVFLEVHAEGEAEHAAIGHNAVVTFVPAAAEGLLRRAMQDHDRDFGGWVGGRCLCARLVACAARAGQRTRMPNKRLLTSNRPPLVLPSQPHFTTTWPTCSSAECSWAPVERSFPKLGACSCPREL